MSRRRLVALLIGLVALGVLVFVWRGRDRSTNEGSIATPTESAAIEGPGASRNTAPQLPDDLVPFQAKDLTAEEARAASIEKAKKTLAIYEETLRYPIYSRPADGSNRHILEWNRHVFPVGQPFAMDAEKREIEAHFFLDKIFAGPGERVTATLELYRKDGETKIPAEVGQRELRVEHYDEDLGWQLATTLKLSPKGNLYVASFVPSEIEALKAAPLEVRVVARVELGAFFKELTQLLRYSVEQVFEVRGLEREAIKDGSLEVTLDVDVKYAAPVMIQAGLYDATGTKPLVVYDNWHHPEQAGPQVMTLKFFGKAIRESGVSGPYRVMCLHGQVRVPDAQPPEVFWSHPDEPALMTRSYSASDFSADEYSSPEKNAKIKQYRDFIANPP